MSIAPPGDPIGEKEQKAVDFMAPPGADALNELKEGITSEAASQEGPTPQPTEGRDLKQVLELATPETGEITEQLIENLIKKQVFKLATPGTGEITEQLIENLVKKQVNDLRRMRAEIQDLQNLLARVKSGEVTLKSYAGYVKMARENIQQLVDKMVATDTDEHIRDNWEMMKINPLIAAPETELEAQEQMRSLETLQHNIDEIVFAIGVITIPSRLNDWLSESRPGYYVPFHLVFEDELPKAADRARLLTLMAYTPKQVHNGFIDTSSGLIYRYNPLPEKRVESVLLVILTLVALTGLVAGASNLAIQGWPLKPENTGALLVGWVAILVGVAVHLGVTGLKRSQSSNNLPPLLVLEDLEYVIDARKSQIMLKLSLALVGLFGLVMSSPDLSKLSVLSYFLVGYSLDSFLDLFVKSIEEQAGTQLAGLKKQLGVSE